MADGLPRTAKTIRINPELFQRAKVAAVIYQKSLGKWLEEAIVEKLELELPSIPTQGQAGVRSSQE